MTNGAATIALRGSSGLRPSGMRSATTAPSTATPTTVSGSEVDRPDVVIIGAGGGGPVVAKELAERGVRVLMLEAGPWNDPDRDYSRLEDDMGGIIDGRLRWGPEDRTKSPWTRRRDGAGLILQASGVGGTTQHFNGITPRMYPSAI